MCVSCGPPLNEGPESSNTSYVNVSIGVDQPYYGGSRNMPYKTISYALDQPLSGRTIEIANGVYDAASGEHFPITLPLGRKLVGESLNISLGEYALIQGSGEHISQNLNDTIHDVAIVLDNGVEIKNLVMSSPGGVAIWAENAGANSSILNNGIVQSEVGLVFVGESKAITKGNIIRDNQQSGIEVFGSSEPVLISNEITMNAVGILVNDQAVPNLGGQNGGGGNSILLNNLCDFLHSGIEAVSTIGTTWDQDVFSFTISPNCADGVEIAVNSIGSINYQFIPQQGSSLFQSDNTISLDQPGFGEVIFTSQPSFLWSGADSELIMVAVWDQPPESLFNHVSVNNSLRWFWHSGLTSSSPGIVQFGDGEAPINANINNSFPPIPLQVGRGYYWAVWGWDQSGKEITYSSPLSYFIVSN